MDDKCRNLRTALTIVALMCGSWVGVLFVYDAVRSVSERSCLESETETVDLRSGEWLFFDGSNRYHYDTITSPGSYEVDKCKKHWVGTPWETSVGQVKIIMENGHLFSGIINLRGVYYDRLEGYEKFWVMKGPEMVSVIREEIYLAYAKSYTEEEASTAALEAAQEVLDNFYHGKVWLYAMPVQVLEN